MLQKRVTPTDSKRSHDQGVERVVCFHHAHHHATTMVNVRMEIRRVML